jgi:AcrR family transcriptional regulator
MDRVSDKHKRAEPLPPDDRRRAIIDAVLPLLVARGAAVTTREMAEAAGIAEGTIFSVFPDKAALIHEAVKVSMDPDPIVTALAAISPTASLENQLTDAARTLLEHFDRISVLVGIVRIMRTSSGGPPPDARKFVANFHAQVLAAITGLFARHEDCLRIDPARAAAAFQGLMHANLQPLLPEQAKLSTEEIVAVLLSGVADRSTAAV